jgi:hypothetical protein
MMGSRLSADWETAETYRIENAIEQRQEIWHPSLEAAIAAFDAEFENDWIANGA